MTDPCPVSLSPARDSALSMQWEYLLPNNYIVLDIKTTGLEHDDVITQICHFVVKDGAVVEKSATLLDWTIHFDFYPINWLGHRLGKASANHSITVNDIMHRGKPPEEVLRF